IGIRREAQAGMNPIVRCENRSKSRAPAVPVVNILAPLRRCEAEVGINLLGRGSLRRLRRRCRVSEAQRKYYVRVAGGVVELVVPSVRQYGEIGRHLRRLGLQEQVIVLTKVRQAFDVPRTEPDEGFSRLELPIDLIADE